MNNSKNLILQKKNDLQLYKQYFENNEVIVLIDNIRESSNLNKKNKNTIEILNNISNLLKSKGIDEVKINLEDLIFLNEGFDFFFNNLRYYDIMGDNLFFYTFEIMNLNKLFNKKLNIILKSLNNFNNLNQNNERFEVIEGGKKKIQKGGIRKSYLYTIFLFFIFFLQAGYSRISLPLNKSLVQINTKYSKELVTINVNKKTVNTSLSVLYNEINQKQKQNSNITTNEFNIFDFINTNYLFFSHIIHYLVLQKKSLKESFLRSYNNVFVNEKTKKNPIYKSIKDYLLKPKEEKKNKPVNNKCPKCQCKCECEFNKK